VGPVLTKLDEGEYLWRICQTLATVQFEVLSRSCLQ